MNYWEGICLGADLFFTALLYKVYRNRKHRLDAIKNAPSFNNSDTLDAEAKQYLVDDCIPYAIVAGRVKGLKDSIQSKNVSHFTGVIQEIVVREQLVRWSWMSRLWTDIEKDVSKSTTSVPFALCAPNGSCLVEVQDPLRCTGLDLMAIHDVFQPNTPTLFSTVLAFFVGELSKGYRHVESMLVEGSHVTGIGTLSRVSVVNPGGGGGDGAVRWVLRPPKQESLPYVLSVFSEAALVKKLENETRLYVTSALLLGSVGCAYLAFVVFKMYREHREKVAKEMEWRKMREDIEKAAAAAAAAERGGNAAEEAPPPPGNDEEAEAAHCCVVCLTRPRQVLILECGHFCCCLECARTLGSSLCPICRNPITRVVPAFVS